MYLRSLFAVAVLLCSAVSLGQTRYDQMTANVTLSSFGGTWVSSINGTYELVRNEGTTGVLEETYSFAGVVGACWVTITISHGTNGTNGTVQQYKSSGSPITVTYNASSGFTLPVTLNSGSGTSGYGSAVINSFAGAAFPWNGGGGGDASEATLAKIYFNQYAYALNPDSGLPTQFAFEWDKWQAQFNNFNVPVKANTDTLVTNSATANTKLQAISDYASYLPTINNSVGNMEGYASEIRDSTANSYSRLSEIRDFTEELRDRADTMKDFWTEPSLGGAVATTPATVDQPTLPNPGEFVPPESERLFEDEPDLGYVQYPNFWQQENFGWNPLTAPSSFGTGNLGWTISMVTEGLPMSGVAFAGSDGLRIWTNPGGTYGAGPGGMYTALNTFRLALRTFFIAMMTVAVVRTACKTLVTY